MWGNKWMYKKIQNDEQRRTPPARRAGALVSLCPRETLKVAPRSLREEEGFQPAGCCGQHELRLWAPDAHRTLLPRLHGAQAWPGTPAKLLTRLSEMSPAAELCVAAWPSRPRRSSRSASRRRLTSPSASTCARTTWSACIIKRRCVLSVSILRAAALLKIAPPAQQRTCWSASAGEPLQRPQRRARAQTQGGRVAASAGVRAGAPTRRGPGLPRGPAGGR